eukprot:3562492-Amphidinium_carterae.1
MAVTHAAVIPLKGAAASQDSAKQALYKQLQLIMGTSCVHLYTPAQEYKFQAMNAESFRVPEAWSATQRHPTRLVSVQF